MRLIRYVPWSAPRISPPRSARTVLPALPASRSARLSPVRSPKRPAQLCGDEWASREAWPTGRLVAGGRRTRSAESVTRHAPKSPRPQGFRRAISIFACASIVTSAQMVTFVSLVARKIRTVECNEILVAAGSGLADMTIDGPAHARAEAYASHGHGGGGCAPCGMIKRGYPQQPCSPSPIDRIRSVTGLRSAPTAKAADAVRQI